MKILFALLAMSISLGALAQYQTVKGHVKSNGTYVAPYIKTKPNGTTYDNIKTRK